MIKSDYKDCDIVVQRQFHPQYQPWVGLIYYTDDKIYMYNVEGPTALETLEKCKDFIDKNILLE